MAIHQRGRFLVDFLGGIRKFVLGGNTADGGANTQVSITKNLTGMADAAFVDLCTITVPNAVEAGSIEVILQGSLGAGGAVGAFESTNSVYGLIAVARTPGLATVAVAAALTNSAVASVAGASNAAVTYQISAITGANSATQTFTVQVKVTRSASTSTNHSLVASIAVLNSQASGITVA